MRALVALAALALPATAAAQTGGIQIAPVLVSMSTEHSIASVRLHNRRTRPVAFEIDAFTWSQVNGRDQLAPTRALLVAPGVFEIPAGGEQVVRLGVQSADLGRETAYRIVMRELPTAHRDGAAVGFALEMSLPVFVTPPRARPNVEVRRIGDMLVLTNTGAGFAQVSLLEGADHVPAPRYLLAGASAEIRPPAGARALRLVATGAGGAISEQTIHVGGQDHSALVR